MSSTPRLGHAASAIAAVYQGDASRVTLRTNLEGDGMQRRWLRRCTIEMAVRRQRRFVTIMIHTCLTRCLHTGGQAFGGGVA